MNGNLIRMYQLISNNKELSNYFVKLEQGMRELYQSESKEKVLRLAAPAESYEKTIKEIEKKKQELEASGIKIDDRIDLFIEGFIPVHVDDEKSAFKGIGNYSYDSNEETIGWNDHENLNRKGFSETFNGVKVTDEILEDEVKNKTSQKEYDKWLESHKNLNSEIEKLEQKIKTEAARMNKKIFGKQKLKENIDMMNSDLEDKRNQQTIGEEKRKTSEFFANLSEEQKNEIIEYLSLISKANDLSVEYQKMINDLKFNDSYYEYISNNLPTAINYSIAQGYITSETREMAEKLLMNMNLEEVIISDSERKMIDDNGFYLHDRNTGELIFQYCDEILKKRERSAQEEAKTR